MTVKEFHNLPDELSVAQFAELSTTSPGAVRKMVRQNVIPSRTLIPGAVRPTYRIPKIALAELLGLVLHDEYISQHLG